MIVGAWSEISNPIFPSAFGRELDLFLCRGRIINTRIFCLPHLLPFFEYFRDSSGGSRIKKYMNKEMEVAWREDETVRYKEAMQKHNRTTYWLTKRIEEDERDIQIAVVPTPKYIPQKQKWSEAAKCAFASGMRSLIP